MNGKQIITTQLPLNCYTNPRVIYEALMQPENANRADKLLHELQERHYQNSEMSNNLLPGKIYPIFKSARTLL